MRQKYKQRESIQVNAIKDTKNRVWSLGLEILPPFEQRLLKIVTYELPMTKGHAFVLDCSLESIEAMSQTLKGTLAFRIINTAQRRGYSLVLFDSRLVTKFVDRKICGHCKEVKAPYLYHKNKNTSDGLHTYCKECRKQNQLLKEQSK